MLLKSHPPVVNLEDGSLYRAVGVLAEVYKTPFSNEVLDDEIANAIRKIGKERLMPGASTFSEKQVKKLKNIADEER